VFDPTHNLNNFASNVAQKPSSSTQKNTNSGGGKLSDWSGVTPSSCTDDRASDLGGSGIDLRAIFDTLEDSESKDADNPFAFTKSQLGERLYKEKDLNILRAVRGLEGLSLGLQVDISKGLSSTEDVLVQHISLEDVWHTLDDPHRWESRRDQAIANIFGEDTPGDDNDASTPEIHAPPPARSRTLSGKLQLPPKLFKDRRRIFGENEIQMRPPKTILHLMLMALDDKVLVNYFFPSR